MAFGDYKRVAITASLLSPQHDLGGSAWNVRLWNGGGGGDEKLPMGSRVQRKVTSACDARV